MNALIDGDIIAYEVGFACDRTYFTITTSTHHELFNSKRDANSYCDEHELDRGCIEKHLDPEEGWKVKGSTNLLIQSICRAVTEYTKEPTTPTIFLSGKTNYRNEVATTATYKGNRDGRKPYHHSLIRSYLMENYHTYVSDGNEADDLLGLYSNDDAVICSKDKDLLMIPGKHYNWNKKTFTVISNDEALFNFHKQLLTGDSVDNIIGIYRMGEVKATKALASLTSKEQWNTVGVMYASHFDSPEERLEENGKLLWIQQPFLTEWSIDKYGEFINSFTEG